MDPGRRAMIEKKGPAREAPPRELTAPKFDPFQRVSKPRRSPQPPARYTSSSSARQPPSSRQAAPGSSRSKYLTQDEQSEQFVAEEDKFVLRQAKKKADIRVREDRAAPIDLLAFQLRYIDPDRDVFDTNDDDAEIDVPSPESVVDALADPQALTRLAEEITNYHTLEANEQNRAYWTALKALCAHRHELLQKDGGTGARGAVGSDVSADVDKILKPKTFEQLVALEGQIRAKLDSDEDIDVDYWEHLLDRLTLWKAKAQLNAIYQTIREARIAQLRESNPDLAAHLESHPDDDDTAAAPSSTTAPQSQAPARPAPPPSGNPVTAAPRPSAFAKSSAAPPPGTARFAQAPEEDFTQTTKALFEREVARGVSENEEIFTAEESLPGSSAAPKWADKYRPRKPRYFNRVQMGYEWNKYNQTHYDHDNPPPKVVQGYKFNIFYPDLIDKTRAPTYKIIREGGRRRGESFTPAGEADTCLIRFVAGPPYEDIAFRIVDKEWDYSAKKDRGFRSTFDKGILQLHFQFKKIFYRK